MFFFTTFFKLLLLFTRSDFSQCSVSCGDGVKTRTRSNTCDPGETESQTVKCSGGVCGKNCGVRWTDWTDCNDQCQGFKNNINKWVSLWFSEILGLTLTISVKVCMIKYINKFYCWWLCKLFGLIAMTSIQVLKK